MQDAALDQPGHARLDLLRQMSRHWWLFMLRGAVAVIFGVMAFMVPGLGLVTILAFLIAWLAVDGAVSIWQAIAKPMPQHRFWYWADGLVSLLAAGIMLTAPGLSAVALVLVAGVWSVMVGLARLVLAYKGADFLIGLLGALTLGVGIWLIAAPGPGLLALVWLVALQAISAGVLLLALGWRLRKLAKSAAASPTLSTPRQSPVR
ncbi:MAG: hypothetical protein RIS83_1704 [Pseudomonadota bacterium]|jgi:uncharacterized membrane protein HdeD (DUF308 family)